MSMVSEHLHFNASEHCDSLCEYCIIHLYNSATLPLLQMELFFAFPPKLYMWLCPMSVVSYVYSLGLLEQWLYQIAYIWCWSCCISHTSYGHLWLYAVIAVTVCHVYIRMCYPGWIQVESGFNLDHWHIRMWGVETYTQAALSHIISTNSAHIQYMNSILGRAPPTLTNAHMNLVQTWEVAPLTWFHFEISGLFHQNPDDTREILPLCSMGSRRGVEGWPHCICQLPLTHLTPNTL